MSLLQGFKPYQLLKRVDYPYEPPNEIEKNNEIVLKKIRTFVSEASTSNEFIVHDRLKIPLLSIMPHVSDNCTCIKELELVFYILLKIAKFYFVTNEVWCGIVSK